MADIPFGLRLLALLLVGVILSVIDFRRRGAKATAHREYAFIFLTGALGAVVGGVNDFITSGISPEYFTFGKGLPDDSGLRAAAVKYGIQVGLSGGVIGGAILMFAVRKETSQSPTALGWLRQRLWIPLAGLCIGAIVLPVVAGNFDPIGIVGQLRPMLTEGQQSAFLRVWRIHAGLYAGFAAGVVALIVLARRRALAVSWRDGRRESEII